ncbi:peptidase M23 [Streptomyces fodineus]|uniref:Peptidase M23 n=1 Tax=Streptomyces fodineus TaxID=1904616 RepID=A0A1D7YQ39_9ACTN|nr:peptidase M23 [Streptomyces fodineus]
MVTRPADWQPVAKGLGRAGQLGVDGLVYRATFPRYDLNLSSYGVSGLVEASYAAFARYPDGRTMFMGDVVATEAELQWVTDAIQAHGLEQSAIHKHLLAHRPTLWWTHVRGVSTDPVALASAMRACLDATATPGPRDPDRTPPAGLDTAAIDAALGAKGVSQDGYRFSFARKETIGDDDRVVPPAMGVTTSFTFHSVGNGRAAVSGDFVLTADEVQRVIKALRHGGVKVVELHNHALSDSPRLFYLHLWAVGHAVSLARTLRTAGAATNLAAGH